MDVKVCEICKQQIYKMDSVNIFTDSLSVLLKQTMKSVLYHLCAFNTKPLQDVC